MSERRMLIAALKNYCDMIWEYDRERVGTSILEIKNALPELEYTEEDANDDNSFFLMGTMDGTVLKYTFKTRVISFFFSENELTAVTLYDTDNWTE